MLSFTAATLKSDSKGYQLLSWPTRSNGRNAEKTFDSQDIGNDYMKHNNGMAMIDLRQKTRVTMADHELTKKWIYQAKQLLGLRLQ